MGWTISPITFTELLVVTATVVTRHAVMLEVVLETTKH